MKSVPNWPRWVGIGLLLATPALAAGPVADDVDEDRPDTSQPGVVARYEGLPGPGSPAVVERVESLPRLTGRVGVSPSAALRAPGFRVRWSGNLNVAQGGPYTFTAARSNLSDLALTVGGKTLTLGIPATLTAGRVAFRIEGAHRGGDPAFELWWRGPGFADEPIAPRFFNHEPAHAAGPRFDRAALEERGAVLAETFACARCHEGAAVQGPVDPLAVLPGPSLDGLGSRVHGAWVMGRLLGSHRDDPGQRMPALFGTTPADLRAARTIAAYLARGATATAAPPIPAKDGETLVNSAGCLACHAAPKAADADADLVSRVPTLDGLAAKWTRVGLAGFLRDPLDTRPHGRMPDFGLSPPQADSVAAFLLAGGRADPRRRPVSPRSSRRNSRPSGTNSGAKPPPSTGSPGRHFWKPSPSARWRPGNA